MRLAVLASHPIQYQAPLFRELARRLDLEVFFAHQPTDDDQASAGFGVGFQWDIDLLSGYENRFLRNVSGSPSLSRFGGCDTPEIGVALSQGGFDALLVTGWHLKTFWQGIWAAKRAGTSVMVRGDSHLDTPRSAITNVAKSLIYPMALRTFDVALYVGARSRLYWEHYGYPEDQLIFSPHCVDNAWFAERATDHARKNVRAEHGIADDARVVLFSGKLSPGKRPLDLVAAARMLRESRREVTVVVAGSGALREQMRDAAVRDRVKLVEMGFCNQMRMPQVYAACDVLVLPSESETWGLVANEALACGKPVVVSDACGCAPDLVADGTVGRVFAAGDARALAEAIAETFDSPPPAASIAAKASAYSVQAAAEGVCHAMESVAGPRKSSDE